MTILIGGVIFFLVCIVALAWAALGIFSDMAQILSRTASQDEESQDP